MSSQGTPTGTKPTVGDSLSSYSRSSSTLPSCHTDRRALAAPTHSNGVRLHQIQPAECGMCERSRVPHDILSGNLTIGELVLKLVLSCRPYDTSQVPRRPVVARSGTLGGFEIGEAHCQLVHKHACGQGAHFFSRATAQHGR